MLPKTDPVHKVTIIPRGRALGVTMQLPETDRYSIDKERLLNMIAVLFGGRIAEVVFMSQVSTGGNDVFVRSTQLSRDIDHRCGLIVLILPMTYSAHMLVGCQSRTYVP